MKKVIDFSVDAKELRELRKSADEFIELLDGQLRKNKIDADVFLGGSLAKGTLAKSERYDADIFVRFGWKYEDLSKYLEKALKPLAKQMKVPLTKLHGSRDYFRILGKEGLTFEIIPVSRIKKVREARNVTDLSYFHVNYVKRNLKGEMKKEMALAKKFCEAQGIYGAESYIQGFSGYGLECLIIHYKTFGKMLKDLVKVKNEQKVLDPGKHYKKKENVFYEINESKLNSPVILVDPTWKDRNVLASLNWDAFRKLQKAGKKYLQSPSERHFERKEFDEKKFMKKKGEFLHVVLRTDRQEGDIAGTKMKKFSRFLKGEMNKYFDLVGSEFIYSGEGKKADFYLVVKKKKEIIRIGPPLKMKKEVKKFKAKNKKTFVKNGMVHSRERVGFSGKDYIGKFDRKKMGEMGIVGLKILQ